MAPARASQFVKMRRARDPLRVALVACPPVSSRGPNTGGQATSATRIEELIDPGANTTWRSSRLIAILAAGAYRRSRTPGAVPFAWRQAVLIALTIFAGGFLGLGLGGLRMTQAPISPAEWNEAVAAFLVIGCTPLGVFLLLDVALRLTRGWEAGRLAGKGRDPGPITPQGR